MTGLNLYKESGIYYLENAGEIIMYRRLEGFIFSAVHIDESEENMLIFKETYLKGAIRVNEVKNDPEIGRAMDLSTIALLQEIVELLGVK